MDRRCPGSFDGSMDRAQQRLSEEAHQDRSGRGCGFLGQPIGNRPKRVVVFGSCESRYAVMKSISAFSSSGSIMKPSGAIAKLR
jgi:hypothetical protein